MAFTIVRQDKAGRNQHWMLDLSDQVAVLTDPAGRIVLQWTPVQANNAIQFPSFSRSIKYTGFNVANEGMHQFSMDGAALKQLKGFANRGIAAGGPTAVRRILRTAIITSIIGIAILGAGIFFLCMTVRELAKGESETAEPHRVGLVTALVGFAVLCRGIYGFRHYTQVKKLSTTAT